MQPLTGATVMPVERFDNGLNEEQLDEIYELQIDISRLAKRVEALPRHRSLSIVVTKLDEARHWLIDRTHRAE